MNLTNVREIHIKTDIIIIIMVSTLDFHENNDYCFEHEIITCDNLNKNTIENYLWLRLNGIQQHQQISKELNIKYMCSAEKQWEKRTENTLSQVLLWNIHIY